MSGDTRNGWCEDEPKYGREACKHHVEVNIEDIDQPFHVCENPASAECGCPGCIINYRLPQLLKAISRFAEAGQSIPTEWVDELTEHVNAAIEAASRLKI